MLHFRVVTWSSACHVIQLIQILPTIMHLYFWKLGLLNKVMYYNGVWDLAWVGEDANEIISK